MQGPINERRLHVTYWTCGVFAALFTLWALGILMLVATVRIARPERIGYACACAAAAVCLWVVFWGIHQSRKPPKADAPGRGRR